MFQIRKEQTDSFRERAVKESRARIVARLEAVLPQDTAKRGHDEVVGLCDRAIDKADVYGMGSEQATYVYAAAMLLFGENFDTDPSKPWTQDFLPDKTMDGDLKWHLLALRIKMDTGRLVY